MGLTCANFPIWFNICNRAGISRGIDEYTRFVMEICPQYGEILQMVIDQLINELLIYNSLTVVFRKLELHARITAPAFVVQIFCYVSKAWL